MPDAPQHTLLDYVVAIGAIATPIMVLVLTAIGWMLRHDLERRSSLEDRLREDRISVYNSILEPYIILFISDAGWQIDPRYRKGKSKHDVALEIMLSLDYRKQAMKLTLIGVDAVVRAYNELMYLSRNLPQDASKREASTLQLMECIGALLLEIRRNMGNESTSLKPWDMIEWFITDARERRPTGTP